MDGFNLCVQIRADPEVYATSIVVVTETSTSDAIVHAHSSGADRVLIKPCTPDRLLTTVAELRGQSRAIVQRSRRSVSELREQTLLTRERIVESRDMIHRSHQRFERCVTSLPPNPPPELACPVCNSRLLYERSYVGEESIASRSSGTSSAAGSASDRFSTVIARGRRRPSRSEHDAAPLNATAMRCVRLYVRRMSPLKAMNTSATSSVATKDANSVPKGSKKRRGTQTRPATHNATNTAISSGRRSAQRPV
jgi:hypothetical protein